MASIQRSETHEIEMKKLEGQMVITSSAFWICSSMRQGHIYGLRLDNVSSPITELL